MCTAVKLLKLPLLCATIQPESTLVAKHGALMIQLESSLRRVFCFVTTKYNNIDKIKSL